MRNPHSLSVSEQALAALNVYCERGNLALEALGNDQDVDAFYRLLRRREAAFANFLALDHLALELGENIAEHAEAKIVYKRIEQINSVLEQLIIAAGKRLQTESSALHSAKQAIAKYKSHSWNRVRLRRDA